MKAWDTNCLVRHLVEDEEAQLAVVRAELDKQTRRGGRIFLPQITLVETAWVLAGYGLTKPEILVVLETVAADDRFRVEGGPDLAEAISRTRQGGDLPEHLICLAGRRTGATPCQTFDTAVRAFPDFEVLG